MRKSKVSDWFDKDGACKICEGELPHGHHGNCFVYSKIKEVAKLEIAVSELIDQRDHWEEKATELANDIGNALGFDVGEHSNLNCPVQSAIDEIYRRYGLASIATTEK